MLSLPPVNDTAVAMAGDNVDKASFAQVQSPGSVKRRSVGDLLVILDASTVQHPLEESSWQLLRSATANHQQLIEENIISQEMPNTMIGKEYMFTTSRRHAEYTEYTNNPIQQLSSNQDGPRNASLRSATAHMADAEPQPRRPSAGLV